MNALERIFGTTSNIVIGAIHFPPLPGYPDFPGMDTVITHALQDARAFTEGGVSGIVIENNYDIPHTEHVSDDVKAAMLTAGREIRLCTNLPIGVSVLWNDYQSALDIAAELDLDFIRVPVFVDTVKTDYGVMTGDPKAVISYRSSKNAERVAIFTDIHVKHAEVLTGNTIEDAALSAIDAGSDALIVSGAWTGSAPDVTDLRAVRNAAPQFPILCGSGINEYNAKDLFSYANGAIVSSSLKEDGEKDVVNIHAYTSRISRDKTQRLVDSLR